MSSVTLKTALEDLDRDQLLATVRRLLVEADSLSSRIAAVNEIGIAMNRTLDLATIQRVVAKQAKWLLDYAHLSVVLKGPTGWTVTTLFGPSEPPTIDVEQSPNIAALLQTSQPQLIRDGSPSKFLNNYKSQLLVTLSADNTVLGSINFAAVKPNLYTQDDMRIAYMLSLQLSSAIRNANVLTELQHTQEALKVTVEELDAYGHTIAHDLKTPLSNVLLWSDLFKKLYADKIPVDALRYIDTIHDSGRLMNRMIDQLLTLAALRHTPQNLVPISASRAIDAALMRFSHQLDERNIKAIVAPDIPDALGHDQWLEEIFANLISNAIKYMGESNPAPRIDLRGMLQGDQVHYEVRDTGVGIKPEDQTRLFEKFTRLHTINAEGLGLGLSIVVRMIKKMGGNLGVESVIGEGSTFWFTLPAAPKVQPSAIVVEASEPKPDANMTKLVVDLAPVPNPEITSVETSISAAKSGSVDPSPTAGVTEPPSLKVASTTSSTPVSAKASGTTSKLSLNVAGFQPVKPKNKSKTQKSASVSTKHSAQRPAPVTTNAKADSATSELITLKADSGDPTIKRS